VFGQWVTTPRHPLYNPIYYEECGGFGDPFLQGTGVESVETRANVTTAFLFTSIALAAIIIILHFLACCRVIRLGGQLPYGLLLVFSLLLLGFTIATAAIPTSEYDQQKDQFNDLSTRNSTFYYKVLMKFAEVNVFPQLTSKYIKDDLLSPSLEVQFGWALGLIWTAAVFAFLAFVLLAVAKCCPPKEPADTESHYDEKPEQARRIGPSPLIVWARKAEKPRSSESTESSEVRNEESPTLRATTTVESKSIVHSQGPQYGSVKESE